jgi:hypothetical protein
VNSPRPYPRPKVIGELVLITILYGVYRLGRLLANGNVTEAFANSVRVWDWERTVRLPDEAAGPSRCSPARPSSCTWPSPWPRPA